MPLARFETPGALRDAPGAPASPFYIAWDELVRGLLGTNDLEGALDIDNPARSLGGFYNPGWTDVPTAGLRELVWMGFPRRLLVQDHAGGRRDAFAGGDTRGVEDPGRRTQVEYLEWRVQRRKVDGLITKVTFTTETEEYWKTLYAQHPDVVVRLYRELLGNPSIPEGDIAPGGVYNPLNDWNTRRGIIHYIVNSPANTLAAAIGLARGSVARESVRDNYEVGPQETTSADPRVAIDIGALARKDLWVTLREPIGVYMLGWDDTGWTKPDGSPVGDYWRVVRPGPGSPFPALRLEYQVPRGEGFVVGEISIGGRPIEYGGQIAEHITVTIGGVAGARS